MNHKLIIFAGACPGLGKSTLSSFLYKQFKLAGINSRWFYEEDVADEAFFPGVTEAVTTIDSHVLDILLQAARILVEKSLRSDTVFITDSLLPFFNWLFTINIDFETIARFSKELELALEPANPLVIYLDGDVPASFRRAVAHRGARYETDFIKYMKEWTYFQAKGITPDSFADIVDFFEKLNEHNLTLLAQWDGPKLILNTTTTGLDELKQTLLSQLSLKEIAEPTGPDRESMQQFVGSYDKNAEGSIPQSLQVTLQGQDLWVDTYWPDGCRLVAQTATRFQLLDTNYYLYFDVSPDGSVNGLNYLIGNKEYSYVKRV